MPNYQKEWLTMSLFADVIMFSKENLPIISSNIWNQVFISDMNTISPTLWNWQKTWRGCQISNAEHDFCLETLLRFSQIAKSSHYGEFSLLSKSLFWVLFRDDEIKMNIFVKYNFSSFWTFLAILWHMRNN